MIHVPLIIIKTRLFVALPLEVRLKHIKLHVGSLLTFLYCVYSDPLLNVITSRLLVGHHQKAHNELELSA